MFNTIDANNCAFFEYKLGFTALVLQVIHSEVLNVVEVLLRFGIVILITEVSQSVETPWDISRVLTVKVFLELVFMLRRKFFKGADGQCEVDACFSVLLS